VTSAGSIARGYVYGSRRDLDRDGALAAISAAGLGDPDILAEAAAIYAVPQTAHRDPRTEQVVEVLFAAGADPSAFDRHCQARRERAAQPRFDLATFADQQHDPPST
jgi:hypothetical protein